MISTKHSDTNFSALTSSTLSHPCSSPHCIEQNEMPNEHKKNQRRRKNRIRDSQFSFNVSCGRTCNFVALPYEKKKYFVDCEQEKFSMSRINSSRKVENLNEDFQRVEVLLRRRLTTINRIIPCKKSSSFSFANGNWENGKWKFNNESERNFSAHRKCIICARIT